MRFFTTLLLLSAGWRPGRDVRQKLKLPSSLSLFPAAESVLREFGNLRVGTENEPTTLKPELVDLSVAQIRDYERQIGRKLYPIGVTEHQDPEFIFIDENGSVYRTNEDELIRIASTFRRALDYFVRANVNSDDIRKDLGDLLRWRSTL